MQRKKVGQHIIAFIFFQCQAINYAFLANAPKTKTRVTYLKKFRDKRCVSQKEHIQGGGKRRKEKEKRNEESMLGSPEASP